MAGVRDTKVIDLVGEGPDGEVIMFIVEERPWDASPAQVDDPREKLISYAGFIAEGSLVRQYPDLEGRSVRIQLDCPEQPTDAIAALLDQAAPSLSPRQDSNLRPTARRSDRRRMKIVRVSRADGYGGRRCLGLERPYFFAARADDPPAAVGHLVPDAGDIAEGFGDDQPGIV